MHQLLGIFFMSLGASMKMSVLLYFPALLLITALNQGILTAILYQLMIVALAVLYGLPFILHNPVSYFTVAYNFSRKFELKESYNYFFIKDEKFYKSDLFGNTLLALHLILLLSALLYKWLSLKGVFATLGVYPFRLGILSRGGKIDFKPLPLMFVAEAFFVCNLIGMACARGMHQQFSIWYSYSMPFLLFKNYSSVSLPRLALYLAIFFMYEV